MAHLESLRQIPWSEYFASSYRLLRVCFFTVLRFPYISAVISLLTCLYDMYDFFSHYFDKELPQRSPIISAAASRFAANLLIGLGYLVPFITLAVFMVINPMVIPLVALHPAITDFCKFSFILKKMHRQENECLSAYLDNPIEKNLTAYTSAKEEAYKAKQDFGISVGLLIGTAITAAGLVCPPLIAVGLAFSVGLTAFGLLDKKYKFSKKISAYFYPDKEPYDIQMSDATSVISMKPILMKQPKQSASQSPDKLPAVAKYPNFFNEKKINPPMGKNVPPILSMRVMKRY